MWKAVVVVAVIVFVAFIVIGGLYWLHLVNVLGELN
jgi:hypothetical protein